MTATNTTPGRRRPPPQRRRPSIPAARGRRAAPWSALLFRLGAFAALWLVVTENEPGAWPFGAAVVGAATAASWALLPPTRLRWRGAAAFVPYFLWQSLRGGLDVARRALDPRLPIAPTLTEHRLRLPAGPPTVVLTGTISLLPGTLAAGVEGERARVHWLTHGPGSGDAIKAVEGRVAGLFGLELPQRDRRGRRRG